MVHKEYIPDLPNDGFEPREWHRAYTGSYKFKEDNSEWVKFKLNTVKSGCGSLLLSEYVSSYGISKPSEKIKKAVDELLVSLKIDGVGAIITTQGTKDAVSANFRYIKELFRLKELVTYPNYRHSPSGNYLQSLYIRNLKDA